MKSKLINLYNYTLLVGDIIEEIPLAEIESDVERDLNNLCFLSKKLIPTDKISFHDVVTISMVSNKKKYNRNHLKLTIGKFFFSKELEDLLIGKEVGKKYCFNIEGVEVQVIIEECLHTYIPTISDELIKEQNIKNVETIEEFKKYTLESYKNLYHNSLSEYLAFQYLNEWFEKSTWEIDQDEIDEWSHIVDTFQQEEMEFHDTIYLENYPGELKEENRKQANLYLKSTLVYCMFTGKDSHTYKAKLCSLPEMEEGCKYITKPLHKLISEHLAIHWKEDE